MISIVMRMFRALCFMHDQSVVIMMMKFVKRLWWMMRRLCIYIERLLEPALNPSRVFWWFLPALTVFSREPLVSALIFNNRVKGYLRVQVLSLILSIFKPCGCSFDGFLKFKNLRAQFKNRVQFRVHITHAFMLGIV